LLRECIPTVIESAVFNGAEYEVIVIDNASSDGSPDFLKRHYPDVITLSMKTNEFWFSVNSGIGRSSYDKLLLLNNDVKLDKGCVRGLAELLERDDRTFAVVPREMNWDGTADTSGAQWIEEVNENLSQSRVSYYPAEEHITCNAGNAMYAKDKIMKLGLFDPLFKPFYYEDFDLSYRAWKAGFRILYEPGAVIYHKGAASVNKYATVDTQVQYLFKNGLLFVWKNITDRRILIRHFFMLFLKLVKVLCLFRTRRPMLTGFFLATRSVKELRAARSMAMKTAALKDSDVLEALSAKNFHD